MPVCRASQFPLAFLDPLYGGNVFQITALMSLGVLPWVALQVVQ